MSGYIGRFAPSPTGPLHFGSLVAALASYLDARRAGGKWLLRMEDLDTPRCVPGAADDILRTLEHFGFEWDGPVLYQSDRIEAYQEALSKLPVYACTCSRKEASGPVYPGTCRPRTCRPGTRRPPSPREGRGPVSLRVRVGEGTVVGFEDRHFGHCEQNLTEEAGDFVVLRSDGLFAYQLAVVVDDAAQNVTDIVRGADFLDSTPRQIYLQQLLGYKQPRYLHVPVATNEAGEKLSKQTLAPPLDWNRVPELLGEARRFLGWDA